MILAFLESIKFVGHQFPVAFLRIYIGYYYVNQALFKLQGDFLFRPRIADQIGEWIPLANVPQWYKILLTENLTPHWQSMAFALVGFEFAIGISFLAGYLVRPFAMIGFLLALNMMLISPAAGADFFRLLMTVHILLAWIGAGRCIGFDYYFYKRHRGLWW